MLIQGLCDYYDILAKAGKVLPSGYSNVKIHYLVSLTEEGKIDEIINYQKKEEIAAAKGKVKEKWVPRDCVMPQRTEKPGIEANVIEQRPLYLFGLNMEDGTLSPRDRTNKAQKSHEAFVATNVEFIEGLDSPVINAFRKFLINWNPEQEAENQELLALGKEYGKAGFAFCLSGAPDRLLHDEPQIRERWERRKNDSSDASQESVAAQCAVTGQTTQIARIHNKIKGVYGGLATGSVLISFKNASETSYGREQSYNSNISETAMKKYTEALNYLLGSSRHKIMLDDMTVVFWAMDPSEDSEAMFMAMLWGQSEKMDADATEDMLERLLKDGKQRLLAEGRLQSLDSIRPEVDFYMVGFKPNSSRLAVKFIYRKKYADILWNLARFQQDLQVSEKLRPVPFWRIKGELISPKAKNDAVNPALLVKIMEAAMYGHNYPEALLETVVRRVRTDVDVRMNEVRAGLIKACLNRNYLKGELKVALDRENVQQAYLYGRLFAVLEKLQQEASGNHLNRTIKDTFFSSASTRPAMVFPRLLRLAQNHLNKSKSEVYFNKQIGEIMEYLDNEFKDILSLKEQGQFMIGYYQQYQSFFEKNENNQEDK